MGIPPDAELLYVVKLLKVATIYPDKLSQSDRLLEVKGQQKRCKVFFHPMEAGKTYEIDMTSSTLDSYLVLEDPSGRKLTEHDGGGMSKAYIIWPATMNGQHRIIATRSATKLEEFTLTIHQRDNESPSTEKNDSVADKAKPTFVELKPGTGKMAKAGDTVTLRYTLALKDGKEIGNSLERKVLGKGEFPNGFDECVPGMRELGVRKLIIPPNYGSGVDGPKKMGIPPNVELHYEVKLLKAGGDKDQ
jgi:FKBP-type peptidyl-prolyl cis-trans isomerase